MKKTLSVLLTICMVLACAVSAVSAENQTGDALDAISETWICPDCGKENDDAFCPWCGAKKPESPASPVVCPGCGAEYEPDTGYNFCKKCGTKLPKEDSPADDPAEKIKGVWTLTNVTGDAEMEARMKGMLDAGLCIRFTFADDGVLNYYYRLEYQEESMAGTYTLEDNRMTIVMDGFGSDVVEYTLSEDTLELTFDQYHYTMVLTRKTEK